jgi:hypothetical protein
MAAWYRKNKESSSFKVLDITQYGNDPSTMLREFWLSLINNCKGCTVYFHNWSGYDAILSLASLLSLHDLGYTFKPILQDGKVICLTILLKNHIILTIKDSIKLIPGSIAKLAKEFKVETQKDHFPHYFNPLELYGELDWQGPLPLYGYFEPKRTSLTEYEGMRAAFKDKPWNFLEVARQYIRADVVALSQILRNFFTGLN